MIHGPKKGSISHRSFVFSVNPPGTLNPFSEAAPYGQVSVGATGMQKVKGLIKAAPTP